MKTNTVIAFAFAASWLIACQPEQKAVMETTHPVEQEQAVIEGGKNKPVEPGRQVLVEPKPSSADAANAAGQVHEQARSQVRDKLEANRMTGKMMASPPVMFVPHPMMIWPTGPVDRENYGHFDSNPVKLVSEHPVSTFSIDVDTGSYANVRRMLREGRLPPQDAVRIEEMINYFSYDYQTPSGRRQPFRVTAEMAPAPWNKHKQLLHIGIKGFEMDRSQLPPSNLVFLVDVSGSMRSQNKLPLLKQALIELTNQMTYRDRISIVVYAGASGVVLQPTPGNDHGRISEALNNLYAGGSTNGGDGIRLAYRMAESAFIKGGVNRVILATDGDFNVGTTNFEALVNLVEQKRKSGISLTALGFGTGNYNDRLMEQIADHGNGNYAYIDTAAEVRKVLVDEIGSTLMTIAKDVKIQIEFNPATVSEYRLIGYENRMLRREDFNNDKVDAGEIGAGHTVTALYEVTLAGQKGSIDPLRYGNSRRVKGRTGELALLRLRFKQPDSDTSSLIEYPLLRRMIKRAGHTTDNFRFAAAVAAFGDILRGGTYAGAFGYNGSLRLAAGARGKDRAGYRQEFMQLVRMADRLDSYRSQGREIGHGDDGIVID
jgi:Ca-activated chloride channel family protein